jgi:hypothetical protein
MSTKPKFSTLFIIGLGHSGSTLLGRMLGCHPDAVFVGELLRLEQALGRSQARCSCGDLVAECPVWQRRMNCLPEAVKTDFRGWTWELIERVRKAENKALLVDSSKSRVLRLKSKWPRQQTGYVLIVRDPRGALRSALRKGGNLRDLLKSSRKWMRRYEVFAQKHPAACSTVFYEDLVASPETELQRLCEFLGLDYIPDMCHPDRKVFHFMRGSVSPFLKGADRLNVDERWQSELTPEQIELIGRCLGTRPIYRKRYGLENVGRAALAGGWLTNFLRSLSRKH